MRASVDLFALHLIGYDKLRNYYGAWEEGQPRRPAAGDKEMTMRTTFVGGC